MRISIRGVSCSGKTTLAKRISEELNIPHIELDELNWLPGWKERDLSEFLHLVEKNLNCESWVIDGNYSKVYNQLNINFDYQVWLDYSFMKILFRYFKRTFDRVFFQRKICNGNTENLKAVFSSDSLFIWILKTYKKRKRELNELEKSGKENLIIIRKEKDITKMISMFKKTSF